MAADDFTYTPNWVYPLEPSFPVIITASDSFAKNYQLIDTTAVEQFKLVFSAATNTTRNAILAHFLARYGGYDSFSWTTVPSDIKAGAAQTVRYVIGSYSEKPLGANLWYVEFVFEIDT